MKTFTSLPVILLAFANDRKDSARYLRNLPDELRRLREALRPAVDQKLCEVVELANATADDIFQVFQSKKYRNRIAVFHFGGHAGGYKLLLESADGHATAAGASGFAKFLAEQLSLELVFLNGCSTQQQADGLLDAGVGAVISTNCAIDDAVATKLSQRFYRALAAGAGLQTAFRESIAAAETEAGSSTRALYAVAEETDELITDRVPWELSFRPGAEPAAEWNLPNTVRNPLFGIPRPDPTDLPHSPYRHLQWFQQEHAEVFFGRGEEIRDLYRKATNPDTAPIILFYGQSGVGKSSLLDAGLLPRLKTTQHIIYLRRDAEQGLSGTLDLAFLPDGVDLSPQAAWHAREKALGRPLTVILDQVEEVFTRPCGAVSDELGMFFDHITDIFHNRETRPQGRLIIGFRKEWLAEIKRKLSDFRLPFNEVFLERLDRRGVLEVVNGPASAERLRNQYGLQVESGLAEQIADDLLEDASGAVAPTLQILLSRMWEAATRDGGSAPAFSRELYSSMRRQGLLLRDFLNRQLDFVEQRWPDIVSPDLLLDLLSLHTTALGTAEQQLVADLQKSYSHHADNLPRILDGCRDAYLLTLPGSVADDETSTRLAHDTLAPLVRERFEMSDHPGQRARRILENRVVEWQQGATGAPLDDVDLSIVEAGRAGMRNWTADELRLIEASRAERQQRRRRRKIRQGLGVAALAAIVAMSGVAFIYAAHAKRAEKDALAAKTEAEQHELAAEKATARSVVLPLREYEEITVGMFPVKQPATTPELDTFWHVLSRDQPDAWYFVFDTVFRDPSVCERVVNRSAELVRATIGLHSHRREGTLALIHAVLEAANETENSVEHRHLPVGNDTGFSILPMPLQGTPPPDLRPHFNPDDIDWRVICACAAIASELQPIETNLQTRIASQLLQELETRDPRLLGETGMMLTKFASSLTSEQACLAIRRLLNGDLEKAGGNFSEKAGIAALNIASAVGDDDVFGILKHVVDKWCTAQHTEKVATENIIAQLCAQVPSQLAGDAWEYLDKYHDSYQSYMVPQKYFKSMGTLSSRALKPEDIADDVVRVLRAAPEKYRNLYAYQPTLKALRDRVKESQREAFVRKASDWASEDVQLWVQSVWTPTLLPAPELPGPNEVTPSRSTAISLIENWLQQPHDLESWISEDNREPVIEELVDIASTTTTELSKVNAAIRILAAVAETPNQAEELIADRESIRQSLLTRLNANPNESRISEDRQILQCLSLLGLPPNAETSSTVQQTMLNGLRHEYGEEMVDSIFELNEAPTGDFLNSILQIAIEKIEAAEISSATADYDPGLRTVSSYGRLLNLPNASIPPDKQQRIINAIVTLYDRILNPHTRSPNGYEVRQLPGPATFLPQEPSETIAKKLAALFLSETGHGDLAAFATARANFGVPISRERRRQMLIKLSLWMYRLPPPITNTSPPREQTYLPAELAGAMLTLTSEADDDSRSVCMHAIMHAMLQPDFQKASGQSLKNALSQIASVCKSIALVDVLKAPWCVDEAQQIVLAELEHRASANFNGNVWAVREYLDELKISAADLERSLPFPPELDYDAAIPTYASTDDAPRPLGQGNPMEQSTSSDTDNAPQDGQTFLPQPPQPQMPVERPVDSSEESAGN